MCGVHAPHIASTLRPQRGADEPLAPAIEAVRVVKRSSSNTHNGLLSPNTPPYGVQGGSDVDRSAGGRSVEAIDV